MPKTFSDGERASIKAKLMDEARKSLGLYGFRKTTVEELTKKAKISKGTFYLFYASKELLFFDVFCAFHDEVQAKLLSDIELFKEGMNPSRLTELIFNVCKMVEESFMLKFITGGEMELLIRKLPPETAAAHAEKDDFNAERLIALVPNMKADNIRVFSAALRGIFFTMLHRHEIGDEVFDDALKTMINGIAIQMFREGAL